MDVKIPFSESSLNMLRVDVQQPRAIILTVLTWSFKISPKSHHRSLNVLSQIPILFPARI